MFAGISKKVLNTDDCAKITLWFPKLLLKLVCMWPRKSNSKLQGSGYWLMMLFCVFIEYGLYNFISKNFTNFDESFAAITSFSTILQVIIKTSILYYYLDLTKNILDVIMYRFWPSNLVDQKTEISFKRSHNILLAGMMSVYFIGICFSVLFLLAPLFRKTAGTPYSTLYPFDYSGTPTFELMYLVQGITNFHIIINGVCGVDGLFMAICSNITAQYKLLQGVFSKLGTEEMKILNDKMGAFHTERDYTYRHVTEEKKFLIHCIDHHHLLLKTIGDVEKVFNLIGFFQLGFSVVALCLSSFLITGEDLGFSQIANIAIFILGHVMQLFCYCSVGNEIDFEMNKLSQYICSSFWYQTDYVILKKDILLVIKKSQQVKKFTVLKLFPLNYETFIQVLRISFSFHTLLSNIAEK